MPQAHEDPRWASACRAAQYMLLHRHSEDRMTPAAICAGTGIDRDVEWRHVWYFLADYRLNADRELQAVAAQLGLPAHWRSLAHHESPILLLNEDPELTGKAVAEMSLKIGRLAVRGYSRIMTDNLIAHEVDRDLLDQLINTPLRRASRIHKRTHCLPDEVTAYAELMAQLTAA
jgi:hypothetical protein